VGIEPRAEIGYLLYIYKSDVDRLCSRKLFYMIAPFISPVLIYVYINE